MAPWNRRIWGAKVPFSSRLSEAIHTLWRRHTPSSKSPLSIMYMVSLRFPYNWCVGVPQKKFVCKMQGKTKDETESCFFQQAPRGHFTRFLVFGHPLLPQRYSWGGNSSVLILLSLVAPKTAYCFSSTRQIDKSPSLFIEETWVLLSHWTHPSLRFSRFCGSVRLTLTVQRFCECDGQP